MVKFALNRLDLSGPVQFADSAKRAEQLGWHAGLLPCNPLKVADPYISLTLAAQATDNLVLGTLLDTPVLRHPSVMAGSIATVAAFAPGRVQLGLGIGDTAVRFNGLAPATIKQLKLATRTARDLLSGKGIEVGAAKPARLTHAALAEVWLAAQGPKTLFMAGAEADGIWIRVGRHPANLAMAWQAVCAGADSIGRDPATLKTGLILHTGLCEDSASARRIGKAIAAGYYEYSPFLFDAPELEWHGPDVHILKDEVYPDFHHHRDPVYAGSKVDFLSDRAADDFALFGDWTQIGTQLEETLSQCPFTPDFVLPHPVLAAGATTDYLTECANNLIASFSRLSSPSDRPIAT